jgi:hypothetical protein
MKTMILAATLLSASSAVVFAEGPASGPSSQTKTDQPAQRRVGVDKPVPKEDPATEPVKPASAADPGGIPAKAAEPKK